MADKLKISVSHLNDPIEMSEAREELSIGRISETPAVAKGIDAKFRIAELLDLPINCVNLFMERVGISSYKSLA